MGKDETRERERGGHGRYYCKTGEITHKTHTHTHAAAYHTGRQLQSF